VVSSSAWTTCRCVGTLAPLIGGRDPIFDLEAFEAAAEGKMGAFHTCGLITSYDGGHLNESARGARALWRKSALAETYVFGEVSIHMIF
jgi:hypothetical protein